MNIKDILDNAEQKMKTNENWKFTQLNDKCKNFLNDAFAQIDKARKEYYAILEYLENIPEAELFDFSHVKRHSFEQSEHVLYCFVLKKLRECNDFLNKAYRLSVFDNYSVENLISSNSKYTLFNITRDDFVNYYYHRGSIDDINTKGDELLKERFKSMVNVTSWYHKRKFYNVYKKHIKFKGGPVNSLYSYSNERDFIDFLDAIKLFEPACEIDVVQLTELSAGYLNTKLLINNEFDIDGKFIKKFVSNEKGYINIYFEDEKAIEYFFGFFDIDLNEE